MHKFNVIDLFCGAGGMSIGFELMGRFRIVGAIDNWQPAINTFRYNHPKVSKEKIICDDLSKIFDSKYQKGLLDIWEAKKILEYWGFDYKGMVIWNKEKMGIGTWIRFQCEFCLLGIKRSYTETIGTRFRC